VVRNGDTEHKRKVKRTKRKTKTKTKTRNKHSYTKEGGGKKPREERNTNNR